MAKKPKRPDDRQLVKYWCECECSNCDIGAHERCSSPKCHVPKWKDRTPGPKKQDKRSAIRGFFGRTGETGTQTPQGNRFPSGPAKYSWRKPSPGTGRHETASSWPRR